MGTLNQIGHRTSVTAYLDRKVSLRTALGTKVNSSKGPRGYTIPVTLGWLAKHKPQQLEYLMEHTDPDTSLFAAVCVVYEEYRREVCQATGLAALGG